MDLAILCIESATLQCSVSVCVNGTVVAERSRAEKKHVAAQVMLPMIQEILEEAGFLRDGKPHGLHAVAVSRGPGSYTGLRIATATAKGIAHALSIPLIAVDTLEILAQQAADEAPEHSPFDHIISVLDARRMEVYAASFKVLDQHIARSSEDSAIILDASDSPLGRLSGAVCVIGDAAEKCRTVVGDANGWTFTETHPHARFMASAADVALRKGELEELAYYQPRYLKAFVAGTPKDPLGLRARTAENDQFST